MKGQHAGHQETPVRTVTNPVILMRRERIAIGGNLNAAFYFDKKIITPFWKKQAQAGLPWCA